MFMQSASDLFIAHTLSLSIACQALAKVVAQHMGGHGKTDTELMMQWQRVSRQLRRQHRSVAIPISALSVEGPVLHR